MRYKHPPAWLYLAGLVLVGTLVRFKDIAVSSFWHDEGFTMMIEALSPLEIISRTARDTHPPLYYLVLHYWTMIFGRTEIGARSLSAVFLIACIPLSYLLIKRLWDERSARFAAVFVALGPFLVRFSQEARMYAMVAFLVLVATYALVRAMEDNRWRWWAIYSISLLAALYTHYFAVFVVVVHWAYVIARSNRSLEAGVWQRRWWISNLIAGGLFLPWLPTFIHQFSRVQNTFWISPSIPSTMPTTLLQFLVFTAGSGVSNTSRGLIGMLFLLGMVVLYLKFRKHRNATLLLAMYSLTAPFLVFLISQRNPIYEDRYFITNAIGFACILGVMMAQLPKRIAVIATGTLVTLAIVGINNIPITNNHRMKDIGQYVDSHYQTGDVILCGELYTFFDFSYYNHTGLESKIWAKEPLTGYNESSLIYDRADKLVVLDPSNIYPKTQHLWVVGKTGFHHYFDSTQLPFNWRPIGPKFIRGYVAVQEYEVAPRSTPEVAVQ